MSVPTFSELLSTHLQRSGISDSELARSIGVRRQTVFRWKEGLVERPRARDDVLRCARKLRLTEEERDLLLLAAGFAPETSSADDVRASLGLIDDTTAQPEPTPQEAQPSATTASTSSTVTEVVVEEQSSNDEEVGEQSAQNPTTTAAIAVERRDEIREAHQHLASHTLAPVVEQLPVQWQHWLRSHPLSRYVVVGLFALFLVLVLLLGWGLTRLNLPDPIPPNETPEVVQVTLNPPVNSPPGFPAIYPIAAVGETLIIVAPFRGYTVNEQYNVAGRIRDVLMTEIAAAKLISTTIEIWPEEISSVTQLAPVLTASDAALVIWGEYDSGRVRVNLDGQSIGAQRIVAVKQDFPLSSPAELITTITTTVPEEIRILALMTLGKLLREQNDYAKAANAFEQAIRLDPKDSKITARLYFYLGHMAEQGGTAGDLLRAQDLYSQALDANPLLLDAQYNRGTVALNQTYQLTIDDPLWRSNLDAAIADFTDVIMLRPAFRAAYQNRGVAYYERNLPDDQAAAIEDFSHLISVDPENSRAYFHRALARLRIENSEVENYNTGTGQTWVEDFERTLAINPAYYPAVNGLCWGYALSEEPQRALPYCDEAVAQDPTATSRDSRAIVYAQLGRYADAIADFEAYLAWVEEMDSPALYTRYRGPMVEGWIKQLTAEENPFDQALLDTLR